MSFEQVSVSPARDEPKVRIPCNLQCFWKKIQDAKKERKSEIEQNIWFLQVKMQFLSKKHINLQSR